MIEAGIKDIVILLLAAVCVIALTLAIIRSFRAPRVHMRDDYPSEHGDGERH